MMALSSFQGRLSSTASFMCKVCFIFVHVYFVLFVYGLIWWIWLEKGLDRVLKHEFAYGGFIVLR